MRPAEVDVLRGNFKKAQDELGWVPKTNFTDLVKVMVQNDINLLKK
jgi:GDPmannose 4,6-dehydratase